MRRIKQRIVTHIICNEQRDLAAVCDHAAIWSDFVVVCSGGWLLRDRGSLNLPEGVILKNVHRDGPTLRIQSHVNFGFAHILLDNWVEEALPGDPVTVVALDPDWYINDPYVVRDAVELNPGQTLHANRYFMWDETNYRTGGIYTPIRVPVSYQFRGNGTFTKNWYSAVPQYACTRVDFVEAPFEVLDYQFRDHEPPDDGTPDLRPFNGMIPFLESREAHA